MTNGKKAARPGKIAKVTTVVGGLGALVVAIGYFVGGLENILDGVEDLRNYFSRPPGHSDCFRPDLDYPNLVRISEWDSIQLRLTGHNGCNQSLQVYIVFKAPSEKVRIESPFSCLDLNNPECWEQHTIDADKDADWKVTPPRLTPLKIPLGEPVPMNINWILYDAETKQQIRANSAALYLLDDET